MIKYSKLGGSRIDRNNLLLGSHAFARPVEVASPSPIAAPSPSVLAFKISQHRIYRSKKRREIAQANALYERRIASIEQVPSYFEIDISKPMSPEEVLQKIQAMAAPSRQK